MKTIDWKEIAKNRVKNCTQCKSINSYTNPFWNCYECKNRFCLDCINGGQVTSKMGQEEEARRVCNKCVVDKGYKLV